MHAWLGLVTLRGRSMRGDEEHQQSTAGAIFLSYASEDAEAAGRICESLRGAGITVWFDKQELRGGDLWDQQIRDRIQDCRLFIAVISANTEHRDEGYFRREWRLAVERVGDMLHKKTFLVPVVIDRTPERGAAVPDKFRELQWTRLPDGQTTPEFVERISRLLTPGSPPATPDNAESSSSTPVALPRRSSVVKRAVRTATVIAAIAMGYLGIEKAWLSKRLTPSASTTGLSVSNKTETQAEKSIAVLPFVDLSEKHDQQYFADGMAEALLDLLATVPGLKVIGRTSSFQFRGHSTDVRNIGAQLGAAYVLEGSVQRSGDRLRITAQLIRTLDGMHQWSDKFESSAQDAFSVQDAIATELARELELAVSTSHDESDPLRRNAEAYDLYLRARQALDISSEQGVTRAVGLFKEVLQRVPASARTLAGLALSYDYFGNEDWGGIDAPEAFESARKYAKQAVALDPHTALAHAVLADVSAEFDFNWKAAEQEIREALEYGGTSESIVMSIAVRVFGSEGDWRQAETYGLRAIAIDPLDAFANEILALFVYMGSGRENQAEPLLRRTLQIRPHYGFAHYELAICLLALGRLENALSEADSEQDESGRLAARSAVLYAMHRRVEAEATIKRLIDISKGDWPSGIARVYASDGQVDQALNWFEIAYKVHDPDTFLIKVDPQIRPLRENPRYKAFLRKMNLPE